MMKSTNKIGTNRGRKRIWLDGKKLAHAGFTGGTRYSFAELPEDYQGLILIKMDGGDRKVTGRPDGKPIIDIVGKVVAEQFGDATHISVTYDPSGEITIMPVEGE
jgi:DNA (cytosine-5)-methyltransferase 1